MTKTTMFCEARFPSHWLFAEFCVLEWWFRPRVRAI